MAQERKTLQHSLRPIAVSDTIVQSNLTIYRAWEAEIEERMQKQRQRRLARAAADLPGSENAWGSAVRLPQRWTDEAAPPAKKPTSH